MSDDTDSQFSDPEEPLSPKEMPYFDPVSAGDWDHLIASLKKSTDQQDLWTKTEPWSENPLEIQKVLLSWKPPKTLWRNHLQTFQQKILFKR